ncbi:dihydroorotase [Parvularcula dongshanensis]|uniref:Dihydroorotase n=1 Tax=Parvularcula dongshanensis TaxID=1173995 RepID=A0A840I339_9PROT|nr:dihydroorotase [Parvularcula dongshanensis]MBB4658460.1 dihydroorotase [Parvularcula dongshanensis]
MTYDLILRGGTVVNHDGAGVRDVGVKDGKIAALDVPAGTDAGEVIDCTGLHVLPGVIDTQVHFREPGNTHKEDLAAGARGAALGGVTAVFEMPNTNPLTTDEATLGDKLDRARGMVVDHAFYMGATRGNAEQLGELELLPGVCGVKLFMGASTGNLLIEDDEGVELVLRNGMRRVAFHSEDEYMLRDNAKLARDGDWTSHPEVRSPEAALRSTERLLRLARKTGRRIHVLHISTADELPLLAANKDVASCECTPQHLTLEGPEAYERLKGFAQMNPPVRDAHHRLALWDALREGLFDVIGSDHAPHTREEKAKPYPKSPSGMPGVQTLLPVMLTHVAAGHLTLERLVDLTSAGANRIFQIAGKGRLAIGYDADFTVVDLKAKRTIRHEDQANLSGWTPFDGFETTGWPKGTIIRGRRVMWEDSLIGEPGGEPVRFQETLPRR